MKLTRIFCCLSGALALISCNRDVVFEDFESNSLGNWSVRGDAFALSGDLGDNCSFVPEDIKGYEGAGYLAGSASADTSSITSRPFSIDSKYVNFLLGGTEGGWSYSSTSVNLIVDGEKVNTLSPIGGMTNGLSWMSWDIEQYKGHTATIQVVVAPVRKIGNREQSKGYILLDQITMSDKNFSDFLPEYSVSLAIDKDYILIPGSSKGVSSRLSVEIDGVNILGTMQRVSLATDDVEYYIPVPVSSYKGKTATVQISNIRKSYKVYKGIITDNDMKVADEPYRPVYHFSPVFGWTNDPNGMYYKDGEWHLSFQYNPYGTTHGNMHWGNAVSKDLVSWENLPLVIAPDELGAIFSGSAVVDHNNTAGFGKDAVVGIYTSAGASQRQSIAYSIDNGRTFTKYENNPVLADPQQRDFRDPKVNWIDGKWVMSLAVGDVIRFYGSKNLKEWTLLSEFGRGVGSHAAVWECPDLMKMSYNGKDKWVLLVSINPGGPNGGSVTQYFIGDFDGTRFKEDNLPYPLWLDMGEDNYAGVTFGNMEDRHVFMGWMSNWWYSNQTPTRYFRNSMTIPRDLSLKHNGKHLILASTPSPEIFNARASEKKIGDFNVAGEWTMDQILADNNGAYEIDFTVVPESGKNLTMSLQNTKGEKASFSFDFEGLMLTLDRSKSGLTDFSPKYVTSDIKTPLVKRSEYRIQLFVDRMSTEMFVNDGDVVFTNCVFPTENLNSLVFNSESGNFSIKNMSVYEMKSNN